MTAETPEPRVTKDDVEQRILRAMSHLTVQSTRVSQSSYAEQNAAAVEHLARARALLLHPRAAAGGSSND